MIRDTTSEITADTHPTGRAIRGAYLIVALLVVIIGGGFVAIQLGRVYGLDPDTYRMLRTWQVMVFEGRYEPSRFQGNIVPEFALGAAAAFGGPPLSNSVSLAAALGSLALLFNLVRPFGRPGWPAILFVAANPYWLIAASSSTDHCIALFFFMAGLVALDREWRTAGIGLLALAAGSRISYLLLGVLLLLWFVGSRVAGQQGGSARREELVRGLIDLLLPFLLFSGLFYLPVFITNHLGFDWLSSARPVRQGWPGLLARFAYKGYLFFGPWLIALAAVWPCLRRGRPVGQLGSALLRPGGQVVAGVAVLVCVYHLALFVYIPAEPSYLLPVLPALAVLGVLIRAETLLVAGAATQIVAGLVIVAPIQITYVLTPWASVAGSEGCRRVATDAVLKPRLEEGLLLKARHIDPAVMACNLSLLLHPPKQISDPLPGWPGERDATTSR